MRIVLTGGATGGHLIPFEPIINALRAVYQEERGDIPIWIGRGRLDIYFVGVADTQAKIFFKRMGVKVISLKSGKLRRYRSWRNIADILFRLPLGLLKSWWEMWRLMPDAVISKGGYGSVPVLLAAMFYRIPYLIHESDAVIGLTTKFSAKMASVIAVGFAATRHRVSGYRSKTIVTGTPVRVDLFKETKKQAKKSFGVKEEDKVLLVVGGSQGAKQINDIMLMVLPTLIEEMAIIHITGEAHLDKVKKEAARVLKSSARKDYYQVFGYLKERMGTALSAADLIITRAGATALAEVARGRKAAIIVPLEGSAQDHQINNAQEFDAAEGAWVISSENLRRTLVLQNIRDLMSNDELRETLEINVARLDHPNAARDVASLTIKLACGILPFQPTERELQAATSAKNR